ncbi:Spermidine/putrescine import ATP-binding protein PotA [Rhodovastum atsumiense]|uniref:ABC transporter ATP-binding protein n=1 Tax=Rhodovastum atsumiense TaxID=504468 RepID=A0A5M6IZQ0_9PROT|nr:ABC transporter ATP-binding protein [Rhodovastum atsumiense]KAA5613449.1 ABC transporter ATP-binding protein [Rhodovastum atsumiense]CAH2603184.1 Spermidine/putrescine import ATP-binding protein PotA [Rhodovastum atsumiense]
MSERKTGATLHLAGISKRYGPQVALQPTDLEVRSGEFLTLLGPSGSGKTTLLSIVAGLVAPSAGEIAIDGQRVTTLPPHRRNIGMVFQNYALFPHLSVFENVAFPLRMRRWPQQDITRAVQAALELVQLPQLAARLPGQLSGGQQQRIALARCLVYRPPVILMDEPLGALDRRLRESIQQEIRRLHAELGPTILYVTHDQEEALSLSDRICLMNHARIAQLGTPAELYRRPNSVFAAQFLGDSNIFSGEVAAEGMVRHPVFGMLRLPEAAEPPGRKVTWMLRPERLRLTTQAPPGTAHGPAMVEDITFAGGLERIRLRLPDAGTVLLTRPDGATPVAPGTAVTLCWDEADAVVLAGAEA